MRFRGFQLFYVVKANEAIHLALSIFAKKNPGEFGDLSVCMSANKNSDFSIAVSIVKICRQLYKS